MRNPILTLAAGAARLLPSPVRSAFYRLGPVTGLIRRILARAAPADLAEVEIAAGPAAGFRMVLDLKTEKDIWLGTYEPQLQQALADFAGPGMTIYDIGANIGAVSLMIAAILDRTGQIYAFEAFPDNVSRMKENIRLNELGDMVTVTHAAVVEAAREVRFQPGPSHATGRAAADERSEVQEGIRVPGISIDHFVTELGHPAPDLVKLDIEGGEIQALPGMTATIQRTRPIVLIELHGEKAGRSAYDFFTRAGYTLHEMRSAYPPIQRVEDIGPKSYLVAQPTSAQ